MDHELLQYVAVEDESGEAIGIFFVSIHSSILVEIHECFLPSAWGRKARRAVREFHDWLWSTYPAIQRVRGVIASSNRGAIAFAESVGLKIFGIEEKSFLQGGKLRDQVFMGLSRPLKFGGTS